MSTTGTILVVDDSAANRLTIEALLAAGGHNLLSAADGMEALNVLENSTVDLVLLDVMMPELDGYQVCQRIRADSRTADLPVVMVTALDDRQSRLRGIEAGADDFISKPFDRDELRTRVRSILRLNRYRKIITYAERADFLEHYDPVTALPNRSLMEKRLAFEIDGRNAGGHDIAVLCIGLENLDTFNESLGVEFGDRMLKKTADCLNRATPAGATLGRLGENKFAIVTPIGKGIEELTSVAQQLATELQKPYSMDEHIVQSVASVGISCCPGDSTDASQLLTQSATALSKTRPGDRVRFFTADMNAAARKRLELESDLRRALENDEFTVHYQPRIDLDSGRASGVEALARWQNPNKGMIMPAHFIPVAEQIGLIGEIGESVMRQACRQMSAWRASGIPDMKIGVNVSSQQFHDPEFSRMVELVLSDAELPAGVLDLELTESLLMPEADGRIEPVIQTLQNLKSLGVSISIDDFGTGYSSLSYLTRFPIDTLKIDRTFVFDMFDSINNATITKSIINLARNLGIGVVAEGVENEGQQEFLRSWQCSEAQGYLFCEPLPATEFEHVISANGGRFYPECSTKAAG